MRTSEVISVMTCRDAGTGPSDGQGLSGQSWWILAPLNFEFSDILGAFCAFQDEESFCSKTQTCLITNCVLTKSLLSLGLVFQYLEKSLTQDMHLNLIIHKLGAAV